MFRDDKRPILEHLDELLYRVRWALISLLITSGFAYTISTDIIELFQIPLRKYMPAGFKLVYTQPLEKFWVVVRVSMVLGLLLALPLLVYHGARFVGPALKRREGKSFLFLLAAVATSFALGVWAGFSIVLPLLIQAIVKFGGMDVLPLLTLSAYVNSVLGVLLLCGILFELPVLMLFLSLWGWVPSAFWVKQRRMAIVVNAVVSAFLSPPDPLSMLAMMLPLHLLYEAGILAARMAEYFSAHEKDKALQHHGT
jgi:sec-independent protein translocase protein TatC